MNTKILFVILLVALLGIGLVMVLPEQLITELPQALGIGLSQVGQRIGQQNKQSKLASALFGEEAEKYADLPVEEQIKIAKIQADQQVGIQKQQQALQQAQQKEMTV